MYKRQLLTGCVGADGEIPDRGQVLDYVDEICAEPYREVSSELVAEMPDDMESVSYTHLPV